MNDTYIEPTLRAPALDAAAYLGDRIGEAEADARAEAQDVAAARKAENAIKEIAHLDFSAEVAARLVIVLRNRIEAASWSHFDGVEDILAALDNSFDWLEAL